MWGKTAGSVGFAGPFAEIFYNREKPIESGLPE
jgi:hypothetical protein